MLSRFLKPSLAVLFAGAFSNPRWFNLPPRALRPSQASVIKSQRLRLLTPNEISKGIEENEHKSKWLNNDRNINSLLTNNQIDLLKELISCFTAFYSIFRKVI